MSAYVVGEVTVTDPVEYERYRTRVMETLQPYQGRFLVRGGAVEPLEGDWQPQRVIVVEFADSAKARAWINSPAYQEILPIRQRAATSKLVLVEGVQL